MIRIEKRKYFHKNWNIVISRNKKHLLVLAEALGLHPEELIEMGRLDRLRREEMKMKSLKEVA